MEQNQKPPSDIQSQKQLNTKLWLQVNQLQLKIHKESLLQKRQQKLFRKQLIRLAKLLNIRGISPAQIQHLLESARGIHYQTPDED